MSRTGCDCLGCAIDGRCDDGEECQHCGGVATTAWGTCRSCEDDLTGMEVEAEGDDD